MRGKRLSVLLALALLPCPASLRRGPGGGEGGNLPSVYLHFPLGFPFS